MATFEIYKETLFLKDLIEEIEIYKCKLNPLFIIYQVILKLGNRN